MKPQTIKIGQTYIFNPSIKTKRAWGNFIDPTTKDMSLKNMIVKVMKVNDDIVTGYFIKHNKFTTSRGWDLRRSWVFNTDQLIPLNKRRRFNRLALNAVNEPGQIVR